MLFPCRDCNASVKRRGSRCTPCRRRAHKSRRQQDPVGHWATTAVRGANRRSSTKVELTPDFLKNLASKQNLCCWYCKSPLRWLNRKAGKLSPTVDKVIPKDGYKKGNVVIACMRCNRVKSDASLKEMEQIVEGLKKWKST